MRAAALAVALIALACAGGSAYALRVPAAPKCTVFPKNNPWNRRVDKLPVARNSAAVIASIGVDTGAARRLRLGPLGRLADRDPVRRGHAQDAAHEGAASSTRTRATASATRSRSASTSRAAATTTRCCSTATPAGSTSSAGSRSGRPLARVGRRDLEPALEPASGPRAGPRRTRPGCRSSPGSRATTRRSAA